MQAFAAVDLGATSGRVIRAEVSAGGLQWQEINRFANEPYDDGGLLRWDFASLWQGITEGLTSCARIGPLAGIGIDSWAVDYGLLGADGRLLADPVCYRDPRTEVGVARVAERISAERLYATSGMQFLPFNTIYQLASEPKEMLERAASILLLPDLIGYLLTGNRVAEMTNASTTALLDQRSRTWSPQLTAAAGIAADMLAPLIEPGAQIGTVSKEVAGLPGLAGTPVYAVGSHDTASAVLAVPATDEHFGYISSGTWSLVGVELDHPVLTDASREVNFTNELGVDGTVRYLKNVTGLWLLTQSQRQWEQTGTPVGLEELLELASREEPRRYLIDVNDPSLIAPSDMPAAIIELARQAGGEVPRTPGQVVRCIIDSLAWAYRRHLHQAMALSGVSVRVIHIVGGGMKNRQLCQATADATGLPVIAGPAEGTGMGNALMQARAAGAIRGDRWALREIVAASVATTRYEPDPAQASQWQKIMDPKEQV